MANQRLLQTIVIIYLLLLTSAIYSYSAPSIPDSTHTTPDTIDTQKDLIDVYLLAISPKIHRHAIKPKTKTEHVHYALFPVAGYTLQTGFATAIAANAVFYNDAHDSAKASTISACIAYTQYNQIILPISANIWTKDEKYNVISDFRYMNYPSQTFGLGAKSKSESGYLIDYSYIKLHQSVLRKVARYFYAGGGFYLDYLWKEREINPPANQLTSFEKYGLHQSETASGLCFQALFDNRYNQVNPQGGFFANIRYRKNLQQLGSTSNWSSAIFEFRKYYHFPQNSKNILALWNYNWLTLDGKPPYLLLPSTGWDDFYNTGRGYLQGRFRGQNMSYLEAEYRFRILKNGLLGGVCFGNLQTFARHIPDSYKAVIPGAGIGLRIKLNKHSNTNLSIDYAWGTQGSRGFFVNLGEVF
jgi:hypothetical protein